MHAPMNAAAPPSTPSARATLFFRLVRFSHTLFALPYAVAGFALAARAEARDGTSVPGAAVFVKVLLAMVCARTAAMAFNRLADRRLDARNPRTASRPSATGEASPAFMATVTAVASAGFVAVSYALNPLCGALSFVALAVVLGYSYTKRFTSLAHFVLGVGLGLSPVGAWLAVRGSFEGGGAGAVLMGSAVVFWTAGFDVLYACQDVEVDRREGLRSVPARLGVARALGVARVCHALVPPLLAAAAWPLGLGAWYLAGTAAAAALLVYEHRLVRADDLSRVDVAFFRVNVVVAVLVMTFTLLDAAWGSPR
jgi:4-hydroxybenzoate polyprenyltransferase